MADRPDLRSRRNFLRSSTLAAFAMASGAACGLQSSGSEGVSAGASTYSARAVLDSIGLCVHWSYPDTPYGQRYAEVRALLVELGVTHVRGEPEQAADLWNSGIKSLFLAEPKDPGEIIPENVKNLASLGAIDAIEGSNEADLFWLRYKRSYEGQGFPAGPVLWQRALWREARSDPRLRDVKVVGPSLGGTYWGKENPYGERGELSQFVNFGNFHPYPGGNPFTPETTYNGIDKYYWVSDFPTVALDRYPINLTTYRKPFGSSIMWATETGYSNYALGADEASSAMYVPRLFLEYFRLGISRTYLYEFVDEFSDPGGTNREANFGLVRHDLSRKPAFYALRSMISILKPSEGAQVKAVQTAKKVDLKFESLPFGSYDTTSVHHIVFDRQDGSFVLAFWNEVTANVFTSFGKVAAKRVHWEAFPARVTLPGTFRSVLRRIGVDGSLEDSIPLSPGTTKVEVLERVSFIEMLPA